MKQEEDRIAGRPPAVIAAATVAAVVAACLVAWGLLALWTEGERDEVRLEPMQATPRWAAPTEPGGVRGPAARPAEADPGPDAVEAWTWVDREAEVARIPVEAAMEWIADDPDAAELVRGTSSDAAGERGAASDSRRARPRAAPDTGGRAGTDDPPEPSDGGGDAGRRPRTGPDGGTAHPLEEVDIDERPGKRVPLDAEFSTADGEPRELAAFLPQGVPTLLVPGYYRCRMLCSYVLEGVAKGVAGMERPAGGGYRIVAVSIDPREEPGDVADRRERAEAVLDAEEVDRHWRFLLGGEEAIRRLTRAIGFGYRYDPSTDQFAHAAVAVALTPDGEVSGYLYGMEFEPAELREALDVAAAGETRSTVERVLVRCFRYLPALRQHAGLIANFLRGGGALVLLAAGAVVALAIRRRARAERRP